jgi:hypothetical protein
MADDNRFFRWLRRINALLFFMGAAGFIVLAGGSALSILFERQAVFREEPATVEAKSGGETYAFGGTVGLPIASTGAAALTHLDGTDEGIMVLQRGGPRVYGLDSGSRLDANDVNYLVVDLKTLKTRWLFRGVKRDIADAVTVREIVPVPKDGPDRTTALLMPVAEADTNGDGKIDRADRHALYAYRVGSAGAVKLFDAQSISGIEQLDGDRVEVTYSDGKSDRAALLSAKDFHTIADTMLSALPPK